MLKVAKEVFGESLAAGRKRVLPAAAYLIGAHFLFALTGLLSLRLFTEVAPKPVFGSANLLIGFAGLAMQIAVAPITQTQLRYHVAHAVMGAADQYGRAVVEQAVGFA